MLDVRVPRVDIDVYILPTCVQGMEMYEITDELTDDSWTYDIGNFNPYRAEVTPLTVGLIYFLVVVCVCFGNFDLSFRFYFIRSIILGKIYFIKDT